MKFVSTLGKIVLRQDFYGGKKVEKLECTKHVAKRMRTRLRKFKLKMGKTKLSDGKTISGRNRLTNEAIIKIQKYDLAVWRNVNGTMDSMKNSIWAEFYHISSLNSDLLHNLCPECKNSWSKYKRALSTNQNYDHSALFHLPEVIMQQIMPILRSLHSLIC